MVLVAYLLIGLGVYAGVSACNLTTFKDASVLSIVKGIMLGLFFWPIGLAVIITLKENGK